MASTSYSPQELFILTTDTNPIMRAVQIIEVKPTGILVHYLGDPSLHNFWVSPEHLQRVDVPPPLPINGTNGGLPTDSNTGPHGKQPITERSPSSETSEPAIPDATDKPTNMIEKVMFGRWLIKTWYNSPYPLPRDNVQRHRRLVNTVMTLDGTIRRTIQEPSVLWVCHQCFKYSSKEYYKEHIKECPHSSPPGRTVYQHGNVAMYEVDGAEQKVYCQNLSLFCKFFIDVKTVCYDSESFLFYILTKTSENGEDIVGYFSKEKISFDRNNLACILTLPPYQKKGFGMLMIEFSYELSRRAQVIGGPEGPLSDLGLRSYLSYWVSTLIRFFRHQLSIVPGLTNRVTTMGEPLNILEKYQRRKIRHTSDDSDDSDESEDSEADGLSPPVGRHKFHHRVSKEGMLTIGIEYHASLQDISEATFIKPRDAAFALQEIGFLANVLRTEKPPRFTYVGVSYEMVEAVAKKRRVGKPSLARQYVLL